MSIALSVLLALTLCVNLGGCSSNDIKYTSAMNERDRRIMTLNVDTLVYDDVVEGVFLYKGRERSEVMEFVSRYEPLLSSDFIEWFISESYEVTEQSLGYAEETISDLEDYEEDYYIDPDYYEEDYYIDSDYYEEDMEEDEEGEEEEYESENLYSVLSLDAYPGKLVATISYLYGGTWKVVFYLNADNQIDGYRIYR